MKLVTRTLGSISGLGGYTKDKSDPKLFATTTREFSKVAGGWSCSYSSLHHIGTEFVMDTVNS
jgi:hypothetical protein